MRASLVVATFGLLSVLNCSTSTNDDATPGPTAVEPTDPAPEPTEAGPKADAEPDTSTSKEDAKAPPPDCTLAGLTGVSEIDASFVVNGAPNGPPTMTGGSLDGEYIVEKAIVFLPSGSGGLVDPKASTGKVSSWAVFKGTRYRLHLESAFTIASALGPQSQGLDTESQGGFKATGPALTLDHACDTVIDNEADYSFTDDGAGHATILIKTTTPYGDTYLQLDASKK